jgi:hypothetical protein
LVGRYGSFYEKQDFDVENGAILGDSHVLRGCPREPEHIVGAVRANSFAGIWMPPVLDVALFELASGGS